MDLVSFVIPAYNSEKTLKILCEKIKFEMEKEKKPYEIILVNDNSYDSTESIIKELCFLDKNILGISLLKNYGQQNALYCGISYSKGKYIFTMDDDLQNPPELINQMIKEIDGGKDLVYCIAARRKKFSIRMIGTFYRERFFEKNFKNIKNLKVSSFRVFTDKLREKIVGKKVKFIYISCLLLKEAKNVGNINYEYKERELGKSNYSLKKLFIILLNLNIYYSKNKFLRVFCKYEEPFQIRKKFKFKKIEVEL